MGQESKDAQDFQFHEKFHQDFQFHEKFQV